MKHAAPLDATVHLDELAHALARAGWSSQPDYEGTPALLCVYAPRLPRIGDHISVVPGPGGVPWFRSSIGGLLAPCCDLRAAVLEIGGVLGQYLVANACIALQPRRPGPIRRLLTRVGICP